MQKWRMVYYSRLLVVAAILAVCGTGTALAQTSSSNNYQISETQFGSGGTLNSCSDQYCARASIGDMTDGGKTVSTTMASFPPITGTDPLLEVIVEPGISDLGTLTPERTATKTMVVKIRSYLSDGYRLQITGNPPKYANHSLATPSSPTASTMGQEQFGINLAENTTPNVGASPVQVPSSDFSFGTVLGGYNTPNLFKYVSGETVASSTVESGQTDYTVSMIINVSNATPAGHFTGDYSAVVIPMY